MFNHNCAPITVFRHSRLTQCKSNFGGPGENGCKEDEMRTEECTLETASIEDIDIMRELWESLPGLGLGPGDDKAAIISFIRRNPHTCLVLKDKGQIIGTVLGGFDGRRGYVYHLAVRADCQHNGYGTLLLENVVQALKNEGAGKIHLLVYRSNSSAQSFYTSRGWHLRDDINMFSWVD